MQTNTPTFIKNFKSSLRDFDLANVFSSEQHSRHVETIKCRRQLGSVSAALEDYCFLESVRLTVKAWSPRSKWVDPDVFRRQIRKRARDIEALDAYVIDHADDQVREQLWQLICGLNITYSESKLVAGSKVLHHLLPDLVVPIDRTYTARFFGRDQPYHFQNASEEQKTFEIAFSGFRAIAKRTNPAQYVGHHRWDTSPTKVIDNAIVGFVNRILREMRYMFAREVTDLIGSATSISQ